jgi:hypothetical protein
MAKASQVEKGRRAREPIEFDTIEGVKCSAAFRPLDGELEADVLANAQRFAEKNGLKEGNAKPGHPIYELGYELSTLVVAMVDAELTESDALFWDGGVPQIQKMLDRDRIALLYEKHCAFQDTVSPRRHTMDATSFFNKVFEVAEAEEGDIGPFVFMRPGLLRSFARSMASQLTAFWTARSLAGSASGSEPAGT